MLTSHQVQSDIITLLSDSDLVRELSGKVYRNGYRPRDSRLEDVIVTFVTGIPTQVEEGAVTINIYVADIAPDADGVYIEDGRRTSYIETLASQWVDSLTVSNNNYRFALMRTISTDYEDSIKQHFVSVQLEYKYKQ